MYLWKEGILAMRGKNKLVARKRIMLSMLLIICINSAVSAAEYTSQATSGEAWNNLWDPSSGSLIDRDAENRYTFQEGSTYIRSTNVSTMISNPTSDILLVSSGSQSVVFNGLSVIGNSVSMGNNMKFENTSASAVATTTGGVNIGDNVTIENSVRNGVYREVHGGAVTIGDGSVDLNGQSNFGRNFTANNNSLTNNLSLTVNDSTSGGAIGINKGNMELIFADNAVFSNNSVRGGYYTFGGAIGGLANEPGESAYNTVTFNGAATFSGNQAVSLAEMARGGAIAFSSGTGGVYLPKQSQIIFNSQGKTVLFENNKAETQATTSKQGQGGAIGLGEGNLYINAENIIFRNNTAIGYSGLGGAIYVNKTTQSGDGQGNVTLIGNAQITGNTTVNTNVQGSTYGGAILAAGNIVLKPNAAGNSMVFRDNVAQVGADIYVNGATTTLTFDYTNGGNIDIYDGFYVRTTDSGFVQTGNGTTRLWNTSTSRNVSRIESGIFSLESAVTMANTTDGSMTTYAAGSLIANKVDLGTATTSARLDIYDGASIKSGLTSSNYYFNITSGNTVNVYGSGSINLVAGSEFNQFGSDRVINIGNNNNINLAARTLAQISSGQQNTRGTDGTKFTALYIDNLGSGNTFTINTNVSQQVADKLVIGTSTQGTNYIKIGYDQNKVGVPYDTKTLVVEAATPGTSIIGEFQPKPTDSGAIAWTPVLKRGENGDNNWYIVASITKPSTVVERYSIMTQALTSSLRLINNNLLKRMGELRDNPNDAGVWLRMYGGESDILNGFGNQKYFLTQGGYDHVRTVKDGRIFNGVALEYLTSNSYLPNGTGKTRSADIGLYQSKLYKSGHYYDLVGKLYTINNRLNVTDTEGNEISTKNNTWAAGVSLEYGYRQELKHNYFIIPQAELTYRYIGGGEHYTSNGVLLSQSKINTLTGRAGFVLGRKYKNNSQVYIEANILHEFAGNTSLSALDSNGNYSIVSSSGRETWYNVVLGTTLRFNDKRDMYFSVERDFGSSFDNKWQVQLGMRWSW